MKNTVQYLSVNGTEPVLQEAFVFWKAEAGDFVWFSSESKTSSVYRQTGASDIVTWRAVDSEVNLESASVCQTNINAQVNWVVASGQRPLIWYESIPIGDYLATGTYTTPIFDGGVQPALMSSSFTALEQRGSSIDTSTSSAFKTIRARASNTPPISSSVVGQEVTNPNWGPESRYPVNQAAAGAGLFPTAQWLNEPNFAPGGNDWMINQNNGFVTSREFPSSTDTVKNLGGTMMYHPDNDELWVMNVLLSGTYPNDLRPIWDVYDPDTFDYVRTDHLQGDINYGYESSVAPEETFEPVGLIWDSEFDEIHIIQRRAYFFIDISTYYSITMDTQGNFKRSSWRLDSIGGSATRWNNMTSITFDGTYYYALTSDSANNTGGDLLMIVKRGDTATGDNTLVSEVDVVDLSSIAGLEQADGLPRTLQCIYNPNDGLIYLFFSHALNLVGNDPRALAPELYALRISIEDDVVVSAVKVDQVDPRGLSSTGGVRLSELALRRDGYKGDSGSTENTLILSERQLTLFPASTYDSERKSFVLLISKEVEFNEDYDVQVHKRAINNRRYNKKNIQFMYSCADGIVTSYANTPVTARSGDPVWGATSGTLTYDFVQEDSVLFPTGRYAQVKYTLAASSDLSTTPQMLTSQLNQGLRVGTIPASGTADLFLRTDIPDNETLGDRTGNLKVFWELPN